MKRIFLVYLADTRLTSRTDLLDWLCSEQVKKGVNHERYWIVDTSTQIFNTYNDPDVNYLMAMLFRTNTAGYQSLMIMKNGDQFGSDERDRPTDDYQKEATESQSEQVNPAGTGEVPTGEPGPEVPPSATSAEDGGVYMASGDGLNGNQG